MSPAHEATAVRYADAWNRHDVDAVLALHTEDAVFENHTSGGRAAGKAEIRELIERVSVTFPDLKFTTRRAYFTENVAVVEWTATATHQNPITGVPVSCRLPASPCRGTVWTYCPCVADSWLAKTSTWTRSRSCAKRALGRDDVSR